MGRKGIFATLLALSAGLAACGTDEPPAPPAPASAATAAAGSPAPDVRYAVGRRELDLSRGDDRPLPTVLLYPAAGSDGDPVRVNAEPAAGKFPIVLFSHGLHGSPERYAPAGAAWASAGFVVALPAYPHTSVEAGDYRRKDIKNQPADAHFVIRKVRDLGRAPGDPLHGRIDGSHVAAVGHSAGGYTTAGMFDKGHDPRLKAGVVMAGWMAPGAFAGPPARILFMHGDSDPVVPVDDTWDMYGRVRWPKAFVLLEKNHHAAWMLPGNKGFPEMESLVTDFLRWNLYGDAAAHQRFVALVREAPGDPGTIAG